MPAYIEVRYLSPKVNQSGLPIETNISFDLVAMNNEQIDINTLQIVLRTTSTIPNESQEEREITYSIIPEGYSYGYDNLDLCGDDQDFYNAIVNAITYTGSCIHYNVVLDPAQPFDKGQCVSGTIYVANTSGVSMTPFVFSFTTSNTTAISDFTNVYIKEIQQTPIFREVLRKDDTTRPRVFHAAFDKWNKSPAPIVEVDEVITKTGYTIDYTNGKIIFTDVQPYNSEVRVSYNFKCFTDEEIEGFINQAISIWQQYPPFGGPTSLNMANATFRNVFFIGGAMFAYQALMFKFSFQVPRTIIDNRSWDEGWKQVLSNWKDISTAYKDMWNGLLETKKQGLPGIATIVTPEFTLPGGRSRLFRGLFKGGTGN